jgi:hypothetical protein
LHEIIPYRMFAVSTLNLATRLQTAADKPQAMEIYVDGKLRIEGNLFAFTNPAIEAGLVHCRALLEFLGLAANRAGRIVCQEASAHGHWDREFFNRQRSSLHGQPRYRARSL